MDAAKLIDDLLAIEVASQKLRADLEAKGRVGLEEGEQLKAIRNRAIVAFETQFSLMRELLAPVDEIPV